MLDSITVLIVFCMYMGSCSSLRCGWNARPPWIKALSTIPSCTRCHWLCTARVWTYYGSVGRLRRRASCSFPYIWVPTIAIVLWCGRVLRKLVRIKTRHHITSIADFISARYKQIPECCRPCHGESPWWDDAIHALQFKAIISTFSIITSEEFALMDWLAHGANCGGPDVHLHHHPRDTAPGPDGKTSGMVMAVAAECLVKLVAFLAAGVFVTYFMFNGFGDIFRISPSVSRIFSSAFGAAIRATT